ncbi:hypothetical protein ARMGADRAFT_1158034, partial [Armillaria gallica]
MTSPVLLGHDISVQTQTTIFNSSLVISLVLLTAVLLPALISKHMYRMRIWYALICSAMVYCVSFLLLVGYQIGPEEPPLGLCVAQTAMVYAAPV